MAPLSERRFTALVFVAAAIIAAAMAVLIFLAFEIRDVQSQGRQRANYEAQQAKQAAESAKAGSIFLQYLFDTTQAECKTIGADCPAIPVIPGFNKKAS